MMARSLVALRYTRVFSTATQCLSHGMCEWRATRWETLAMSGLVVPASYMTPPTACLKGQSVTTSPSVVGPSSATGGAGILKKRFTSKHTSMASTLAGWLIYMVSSFQPRFTEHPRYHSSCTKVWVENSPLRTLSSYLPTVSFLDTRRSSTFTTRTNTTFLLSIFQNTHGFALHCSIPNFSTTVLQKSADLYRPVCFTP